MVPKPSPELDVFARTLLARLTTEHPLPLPPTLEWRAYRTTAGMARFAPPGILLGARLLSDARRVEETMLHEYAHLLAVARHGTRERGHGPAWRQAMIDLGADPKVTHAFQCSRNRSRQTLVYRCDACGLEFVRRRLLSRSHTYVHRVCGGKVRFVRRLERTNPDAAS